MSQYINSLEIGSFLKMRGPFGKLNYFGDGNFKILKKFKLKTFNLITRTKKINRNQEN